MICSIYCFTNKINGKQYIGSTVIDPQRRYSQHIYNCTHENTHQHNYPLYLAMRKYGVDNFVFEVLYQEDCGETRIREIEAEYIKKMNTLSPNGYNQTLDTKHPLNDPAIYTKMSETKREKTHRIAAYDENMNFLGIWRSAADYVEEHGLSKRMTSRIGECCRGLRKTTEGYTFCYVDENDNPLFAEYIGPQYKGEKGTTVIQKNSKRVCMIDINTHKILKTFDTIALASREMKIDSSGITKCCKRKRKTTGGYIWRYAEEVENGTII